MKQWREKHRAQFIEGMRLWREKNPEKVREARRNRKYDAYKSQKESNRRKRIQLEALEHYGGACYCCGETHPMMLALDHINGGGNQHRKEIGVTQGKLRLAEWARNNGWPPIFRVACHSCNFATHLNGGICPHQQTLLSGQGG